MTALVIILPVRYDTGLGWHVCDVYRAQQWGVVAQKRGQRAAIIVRHPTKVRAEQARVSVERMFAGPARSYRFGSRMERLV